MSNDSLTNNNTHEVHNSEDNENWQDILRSLGYSLDVPVSGFYRCRAIYRGGNNPTSLSISQDGRFFRDWGAQKRGSIRELIALTKGININEVNLHDTSLGGEEVNTNIQQRIKSDRYYSDDCLDKLANKYEYFMNRGISAETQKIFEMGLAMRGEMKGRMVFPIRDFHKRIIGFTGRRTYESDTIPKYKHIGLTQHFVYNHIVSAEAVKNKGFVILVESPADTISLYEVGYANCLCLFGVNISIEVIKYLITLNKKIIISTNNDGKNNEYIGEKAARKIKRSLSAFFNPEQIEIKIPPMKDFNDMLRADKENLKEWLKSIEA